MRCYAYALLLAAVAAPTVAQQSSPQPTGPTGPDSVSPTPLSTDSTPADGPRARQGDVSANRDAAAAGGGLMPPPPPPPPPNATMVPAPSPSPIQAFPPPAPLDHYPICKANQFDGCMEPGAGPHRQHR